MVGVDHMGIDLRVRDGMEMKTLRFPFKYPVSSALAQPPWRLSCLWKLQPSLVAASIAML